MSRVPSESAAEPMRAEVLAVGGRGAPLVYVPGIDGSGEMLLGAAARLERRFRLTRLCYRGGTGGDHFTLAASVTERLREAAAGRPDARALVLAESFGVAVALAATLDAPACVAGLALVNGFARFRDRLGLALTRGVFALAPQAWIHGARARFAQRGLFDPRHDGAALQALVELPGNWFDARYRARLAWIREVDLRPRLAAIRCPVAIWAADRDRVVASVPCGREMAAAIPGAEMTVLHAAGHVVLPLAEEPWEERLEQLAARAGLR